MNLPNILTISRMVLAAIMLLLLSLPDSIPLMKSLAFMIFVVAGITDYFDGYLARTTYGVTAFGKLMDPLADKVMVCAAFVSFVDLKLVPAYIVVIIISREFLVTGLRLLAVEKGIVISAGKWGKHKTVWQIVSIIIILLGLSVRHDVFGGADATFLANYDLAFGYIAYAISIGVALITVASGYLYFIENKVVLNRHL
jgi:CDP-diacylglycerol---glycerol-3-phosphate 3-phosphatidyltransferase